MPCGRATAICAKFFVGILMQDLVRVRTRVILLFVSGRISHSLLPIW